MMQVIRWIVLGLALLPTAVLASKPVLVLPVQRDEAGQYQLWEDSNRWKEAWKHTLLDQGENPRIILPIGDIDDVQHVGVDTLIKGDEEGLQVLAAKYRAGAVVVVESHYKNGVLNVQMGDEEHHFEGDYEKAVQDAVNRLSAALETHPPSKEDNFQPIEKEKAEQAAEDIAEDVADEVLEAADISEVRQVVFPLDSIVDWVQVKGKLNKVELIEKMDVQEVTNAYVKLQLTYKGDLARALAKQKMTLTRQDNDWVLTR